MPPFHQKVETLLRTLFAGEYRVTARIRVVRTFFPVGAMLGNQLHRLRILQDVEIRSKTARDDVAEDAPGDNELKED